MQLHGDIRKSLLLAAVLPRNGYVTELNMKPKLVVFEFLFVYRLNKQDKASETEKFNECW